MPVALRLPGRESEVKLVNGKGETRTHKTVFTIHQFSRLVLHPARSFPKLSIPVFWAARIKEHVVTCTIRCVFESQNTSYHYQEAYHKNDKQYNGSITQHGNVFSFLLLE